MKVGLLTIHIHIPGCTSLKQKRHRIKPLLARLHREFNISAAEIGNQDSWQEAVIAISLVSNDSNHTQQVLQNVLGWIENYWPDVFIVENKLELI